MNFKQFSSKALRLMDKNFFVLGGEFLKITMDRTGSINEIGCTFDKKSNYVGAVILKNPRKVSKNWIRERMRQFSTDFKYLDLSL